MKSLVLLLLFISVSGNHYITISSNNYNSYINDNILFYSTNHQKFKWSCMSTTSSSLSSSSSSTTTTQSSIIVSSSNDPLFSSCKYDSNHYIYQKQQYQKTVQKVYN